MLLSQLRWLGALAIGVAVMIAVYLDPEVDAPGGRPAPSAPEVRASAAESETEPSEASRRETYEKARKILIENTPEGPVREAALASLRRQYFPEATQADSAPTPPAPGPDSP